MERLSSCYFCGDAVDAAIEEYPLVVSETYDDVETDQRIVLCPSCRRKLTAVVERVLEAALNGEEEPADVDSLPDGDELLVEVDEPSNGREMTATNVEPIDESGGAPDDDSEAASDPDDDGDETDRTEDGEAEPETEDPGSAWVSAGESGDRESDTDSQGAEDATADPADESADATASAGSDESGSSHSFDRAEYNNVVKLLQNREFPVDIEEFTVVAQGAYGIERSTTHEILDALIERGVIEDRGDRLVRS